MAEVNPTSTSEVDVALDATLDAPTTIERIVPMEEIQAMIAQLSVTEDGEPLRNAMNDLKKAIKFNPAACASLLPEDIGQMVAVLDKLVDRDLQAAIEKANKKGKGKSGQAKIDYSDPKVQQEILDDL